MPRARREPWLSLLPEDPRPWILASGEPAARLVALRSLYDRGPGDAEASEAHAAMLADAGTRELVSRLPNWERETKISGHNAANYAPNLLGLLADMGVGAGDDPRIEKLLDQMLKHQDAHGRFQTLGRWRGQDKARWGALLCDTHAIAEVLIRFGRGADARVGRCLDRMASDLTATEQGKGWLCIPDAETGFRGPGRKSEICLQVSLEALRCFGAIAASRRPKACLEAGRACVRAWRVRGQERPYMFGHGKQFKTVKWPPFWYGLLGVLDTLSRFPSLWKGSSASAEDRRAIVEMTACLAAYNLGPDGRVTPQSCYKGFESFSFGQKKVPSPFATARVCAVLRSLGPLAEEARGVDVRKLGSSKGGTGKAVPPRG